MNIFKHLSYKLFLLMIFYLCQANGQYITGRFMDAYPLQPQPVDSVTVYIDEILKFVTDSTGTFGVQTRIVIMNNSNIPLAYEIKNAFPNPFNSLSIIEYTIPYISDIKIYGFNVLGQLIFEEEEKRQKPGTYRFIFDSAEYLKKDLASQKIFIRFNICSDKDEYTKVIPLLYIK